MIPRLPFVEEFHTFRMNTLTIPLCDDFHVHVRQDDMMKAVVPYLAAGGMSRVLVMPNTTPPITSTAQALAYKEELEAVDPNITYLMTMYLHPDITVEEVHKAADAGIVGIKSYPRGVTTNSDAGIEDYSLYYPLFEAMQERGLVLELHGEIPSDHERDICVLNAEEYFLSHLKQLYTDFPYLRIVLEHITTAAAVAAIREAPETVGATVTAHHLELTVDDWAGQNHNFCKPVAKYPHDRAALREIVAEGHPRVFLGSDSAPHPRNAKEAACGCAGVFTSPLLAAYVADTLESLGCLDRMRSFACEFGADFYGLPRNEGTLTLSKQTCTVPASYGDVVPFRASQKLSWSLCPHS